jgi:multiple sugar transport system permease protein
VITKPELMNVTAGATEIRGQGINELETALLTGLPIAIVYLLFQRRVTEAVMLSAGIKG